MTKPASPENGEPLPNTDELTVVKHLAAGHSLRFAAAAVGLSEAEVGAIASRHGCPRRDRLAQAAVELQRAHDLEENAVLLPTAETVRDSGGGIVEVRGSSCGRPHAG